MTDSSNDPRMEADLDQLAREAERASQDSLDTTVTRKPRSTGTAFWLLVAMAGLTLVLLFMVTRAEEVDDTVPEELLGRWTTTSERYADRAFEITRNAVVFYTGTGNDDWSAHVITSVEATQSERGTLYVVGYLNQDVQYEFSFYFRAAAGGVIQFKNQPGMRWIRAGQS